MDMHSPHAARHADDRRDHRPSIGALVAQLAGDMTQLVRTELKLAQAEVKQNVGSLARPATLIAAGGVLLLGALFTMMGAFVAWLTPLVGAGWAAFIVAAIVGGIGYALVMSGKKQIGTASIAPTRTASSLRRDAEALKGHHT